MSKNQNQTVHNSENLQKNFTILVQDFWKTNPYIFNPQINQELEVRFGTKGIKSITKFDYDNVIGRLKSFGFHCKNPEGEYLLRIQNQYITSQGYEKMSSIRTEIKGFHEIQEYCKHNEFQKIKNGAVTFYDKQQKATVDFNDFNFRVSYATESRMNEKDNFIKNMIRDWTLSKKTFRYINRVSFTHDILPISFDMSIVKSSTYEYNTRNRKPYPIPVRTTQESKVFENQEVYEIELEIDNTKIGPSTATPHPEQLLSKIKMGIKYIMIGLQETNYPVSYPEMTDVLHQYMTLIHGVNYNSSKPVYPSHFIGPSSFTLQIKNIIPINANLNEPNIRQEYTVTDKADGARSLMYISSSGKIYLINTNMKVIFSGAKTNNEEIFDSLLDGEIILHNKEGKFINLYATFDIYFIHKKDIRSIAFVAKEGKEGNGVRLSVLKEVVKSLNPVSVVKNEVCPIRITSKEFYPLTINTLSEKTIFDACQSILRREEEGEFEYNTDGLIFTPASFGVGTDGLGKPSPNYKITWDSSFKWKPPQFNTIDFLVETKKKNGMDIVSTIFQDGLNTSSYEQSNTYKTLILKCGFNQKKHGYLNPCQDVIDDNFPKLTHSNTEEDNEYTAIQFIPTNPFVPDAGICNIMLQQDDTGAFQMKTAENEVFGDDTIVEFSYDLDESLQLWRWKPLRVRYDKTAELRQGIKNFGNAYHVANSNWNSIHNPITEKMITTGKNIPDELADDDVYYNRISKTKFTKSLRDFHNLYIKKRLIASVCKREDILIDYACGKAGDLPKWIKANLSFVFGIDVSNDNLENRLDGACARYLSAYKKFKTIPSALFVNGNSGLHIRSGLAMKNEKAIQITKAIFGQGTKKEAEKIGKAVAKNYAKGADGFHVSSCQFAMHYFFENQVILQNFMRNLAECTKLGGYFIGTCYDGIEIFKLLKYKKQGESIALYDEVDKKVKLWEITKEYDNLTFEPNASSLGIKIDVYQESIDKSFAEYLVHFDYVERVMENYGFKLVQREDANALGLPDGSGLFEELYQSMMKEVKDYPYLKNEYGTALNMSQNEKTISFLNRYFVYKKIRHVNTEKNVLLEEGEVAIVKPMPIVVEEEPIKKTRMVKRIVKDKIRKLNKNIVLIGEEDIPSAIQSAIQSAIPSASATNAIFVPLPTEPPIKKYIKARKMTLKPKVEEPKVIEEEPKAIEEPKVIELIEEPKVIEEEPKAIEIVEAIEEPENTKQKRCPKGTRRNKKTGECEPVKTGGSNGNGGKTKKHK